MGVFGFVMSGGGAVGVLLGGVLTGLLTWHWIFLVNVPIGIAVLVAARAVLPADDVVAELGRLDVPGAVLVTVGADARGLRRRRRQRGRLDLDPHPGPAGAAAVLLVAFVVREAQAARPARPAAAVHAAQRRRSRRSSACCGPAAMFAWFFLAALYLQQVLGYGALEVGLAFVPTSAGDGVLLAAGLRPAGDALRHPPAARPSGLALAAASLALFAHGPGRRQLRRPTCCPRWCCSASAPASPSTRCCWPRWATSSRTRPGSPPASSTPRS